MIEKAARKLAGTSCLKLDEHDPPKQEIWRSRMTVLDEINVRWGRGATPRKRANRY